MGTQRSKRVPLGLAFVIFSAASAGLISVVWAGPAQVLPDTQQAPEQAPEPDPTTGCYGVRSSTGSIITGPTERRPHPSIVLNGQEASGRWFGPGARSNWHCHTGGQVLLVMQGKGRVQQRGQRMRELEVGETEYAGAYTEHWHGAAPDQEVHYYAINFDPFGDLWMEPVSEADYLGMENDLGLKTRAAFIEEILR